MKTIGLIGGMSWESTIPYYRIINETVRELRGGLHSAKIVMASVDFAEIEHLQRLGDWDSAGAILADCGRRLALDGADFLVLCTNTMHKVAPAIEAQAGIELLHIADPTAREIRAAGLRTVGLLGTRFTMEQDFYRARLEAHGLTVMTPDAAGRDLVHRVIYEELCQGRVLDASRDAYRAVIEQLADAGAQAVIFGCTEIGLLVTQADSPAPVFDTTALHARKAAEQALK
ncbi:aspartate/glutamate racemase family protein [Massilia sp. G4R7]|uniref:Aspartate/glutamate racemase family protein n=1 Tax=Massilia phyllostachyos TaxID=2898585 RepID=A0ABS8Q2P2_9BURK|nr:aspartate/glutamate racemase family protein [Massilia phyllostachyos]MCD2515793.1 aspartate/glutamate racemase family protein [Massilia phyllostachyos]